MDLSSLVILFVVSGPKFIGLFPGMRQESLSIVHLSDFGFLDSFRIYSRSDLNLYKIYRNFACFGPIFVRAPNFEGCIIKFMATLHGDRPRELGDFVAKGVNNIVDFSQFILYLRSWTAKTLL